MFEEIITEYIQKHSAPETISLKDVMQHISTKMSVPLEEVKSKRGEFKDFAVKTLKERIAPVKKSLVKEKLTEMEETVLLALGSMNEKEVSSSAICQRIYEGRPDARVVIPTLNRLMIRGLVEKSSDQNGRFDKWRLSSTLA